MKKNILYVFSSILVIVMLSLTAFASSWVSLYDPVGVLSNDEIQEFERQIEEIEGKYDCPIFITFLNNDDMGEHTSLRDYNLYTISNETKAETGIALAHNIESQRVDIYISDDLLYAVSHDNADTLFNIYNDADTYNDGITQFLAELDGFFASAQNIENTEATTSELPATLTAELSRYVIDNADVLSDSFEISLATTLKGISESFKADVVVLTVSDLEGKTPQDYADDYYDNNDYGYGESKDGVLILYKENTAKNEEIYITTCGGVIPYFTDSVIDSILNSVHNYILENNYETAFNSFASSCSYALSQGSVNNTGASENTSDGNTALSPELSRIVIDNANLLSSEYEKSLAEQLKVIIDQYLCDIVVLTITDLEGKTPQAYADDYFDYNGYGKGENRDGLLVLYKDGKPGNRELYISTTGFAIEEFNDIVIEEMLDGLQYNIAEGNYEGAYDFLVRKCNEELAPETVSPIWIPICIVGGFLVAYIIIKKRASGLKSVVGKFNAVSYIVPNSPRITGSYDNFLYKNVSKSVRVKQTSSSGSSGSSTHTSSSGSTHGGGGRSF